MTTYNLICKNCSSSFEGKSPRKMNCNECEEIIIYKLKNSCSICGKIVKFRDQNGRGYDCNCHANWCLEHFDKINEKRKGPGICLKCGDCSEKRDGRGFCTKCINYSMLSKRDYGNCTNCGKLNNIRDQFGYGKDACNCSSEFSQKIINLKTEKGICQSCNMVSNKRNQFGYGYDCGCHEKYFLTRIEGNKKSGICKKCKEFAEIRDQIGLCYICSVNALAFIEKDDKTFYYDKSVEDYILWNDYKEKFQFDTINYTNFIKEIKEKYPQTFLQTTFRDQDSNNWSGSKQAFEFNLVENNVIWFVYIKFYIKDNKILPLVVGKTGSKLANCSGTDVSFSTDTSHGPARRFLNECDLNWDKTQILIIPCGEKETYKTEMLILCKYNLFKS